MPQPLRKPPPCVKGARISRYAILRPSAESMSTSVRFTATSSSPVVSITRTLLMPAAMAACCDLLPAMIRLFLSSRMLRPAPNSVDPRQCSNPIWHCSHCSIGSCSLCSRGQRLPLLSCLPPCPGGLVHFLKHDFRCLWGYWPNSSRYNTSKSAAVYLSHAELPASFQS